MSGAKGNSMRDQAMTTATPPPARAARSNGWSDVRLHRRVLAGIAVVLVLAPMVVYPVFLMKLMCFAMFALAFNLLLVCLELLGL